MRLMQLRQHTSAVLGRIDAKTRKCTIVAVVSKSGIFKLGHLTQKGRTVRSVYQLSTQHIDDCLIDYHAASCHMARHETKQHCNVADMHSAKSSLMGLQLTLPRPHVVVCACQKAVRLERARFRYVYDQVLAIAFASLFSCLEDGLKVRLQMQMHKILWPDIERGV